MYKYANGPGPTPQASMDKIRGMDIYRYNFASTSNPCPPKFIFIWCTNNNDALLLDFNRKEHIFKPVSYRWWNWMLRWSTEIEVVRDLQWVVITLAPHNGSVSGSNYLHCYITSQRENFSFYQSTVLWLKCSRVGITTVNTYILHCSSLTNGVYISVCNLLQGGKVETKLWNFPTSGRKGKTNDNFRSLFCIQHVLSYGRVWGGNPKKIPYFFFHLLQDKVDFNNDLAIIQLFCQVMFCLWTEATKTKRALIQKFIILVRL